MTYEEYIEKLISIDDRESQVDFQNEYAWTICRVETQNSYDIALGAYQLAVSLAYKRGQAESCRTIGNCYLLFGDYKRSIIEIEIAINLFKELGDRNGEAESLNLYGIVYSLMGNYELAISHFEISLEIFLFDYHDTG